MATVYRTQWSEPDIDNPDETIKVALDLFDQWADPEGAKQQIEENSWALPTPSPNEGNRRITIREIKADQVEGFIASVQDDDSDDINHTTWITTFSYYIEDGQGHVWIETQLESDDLTRSVRIGSPRLIHSLLGRPGFHVLEGSVVSDEVNDYDVSKVTLLVETLRNPKRALPYIVFTEPEHSQFPWRSIAKTVARRSEGTAVTVTLDALAAMELRRCLGDLAVWDGAVRFYATRPVDSTSSGVAHRFYRADRIAQGSGGVMDRLVGAAAEQSSRRRVPERMRELTRSAESSDSPIIADLNEKWSLELLIQAEEHQETIDELGHAQAHLKRIRQALADRSSEELFWKTNDATPEEIPETVQDTSEAVMAARLYLADRLSIPDGVERDLYGIDTAPNSYAWGNAALRGLNALAMYCAAKMNGFESGFWEWCQTGSSNAWPASSKKLAMRESETVMSNDRMVAARTFPVVSELHVSGRLVMQAHLKISEGGGDLAPRIYFYDDTTGPTQMVHIGFVGPHFLVPNTKS